MAIKEINPLVDFDWDAFENDGVSASDKAAQKAAYEGTLNNVNDNEVVDGKVTAINDREVVVNIGYKSEGIIARSEFRYAPNLKVGDTVEVYIENQEDKKGQLVLSHKKARQSRSWERVNAALENNEVVTGFVKCRTKGGMIVDVLGTEAFLPGAQIDVKPIRDYDTFVGKNMEFKIVKINQEFRNVVVSHKALIEAELEQQKKEIISKLEKGQILEGTVKNITNYGVFIDLGGVDGLIHISDLSWTKKVKHPSEFTKVGEMIDVQVLDIDKENRRLSLGHKQLEDNPWNDFEQIFTQDSVHTGKITEILDKGAVVALEGGVEGFATPKHLVKEDGSQAQLGETLEFKVIEFNKDAKRIILSHSRIFEDVARAEAKAAKKAEATAKKATRPQKEQAPTIKNVAASTSLGDIDALAALKAQMEK